MIMHNRKVFYDESIWERMEAKLKSWVIHRNDCLYYRYFLNLFGNFKNNIQSWLFLSYFLFKK